MKRVRHSYITDFYRQLLTRYQPLTADTYADNASNFIQYLESKKISLYDVTNQDIDRYMSYLKNKGYSNSTISIRAISAYYFCKYLSDDGKNPNTFKMPKLPPDDRNLKERTSLSEVELYDFINKTSKIKEPYSIALKIMAYTGMRIGEIVKLKISDITVKNNKLFFYFVSEKSNKKRLVPIIDKLSECLKDYLSNWLKPFYIKYSKRKNRQYLLPSLKHDRYIDITTLRKQFDIIAKEINRTDITPHSLRRTYLTILSKKGVSPFVLKMLAGHAKYDTTSQYIVIDEDHLFSKASLLLDFGG
ncbi:MAG: site-specific integrase [Candidatus Anstonellales archaeon]